MKKANRRFQIMLCILFIVLSAAIIYPFLLLVGVSLSDEMDVAVHGYSLIPRQFTLDAYKYVFKNHQAILRAYGVTIAFSVIGTVLSVLFTAMFAYPLTRKKLPGCVGISFYLYFTMLFGGGLVPTYILITKYLHLGDTLWVYILPGMISGFSVFMMRTFFQGLPEEMFESMKIDGATHYNIFFRTVLSLSKPVIATVAVTCFLGKWNDWYTAMIYINKEELISLQYFLQRIMKNIDLLSAMSGSGVMIDMKDIPSETVRMAMAVVVAGPALFVFPFFQKYFVSGLTIGAVKG